jgi:uncharacterized protein YyaL (SSP411 family)
MRSGTTYSFWTGLFVVAAGTALVRGADDTPKVAVGPANRLARETSPYLLLHAHNPVDWYPWGPEALAKARAESKPIFLSIGYSSCYWCHVMERESFVDPEIARALNASFVCIKVDREERPDVDQVYMAALQAFRPGGWPMSLFLTPDGRPFFGGTYFPPKDREGSAGFLTIVTAVAKAWTKQRAEIDKTATEVTEAVRTRLRASSKERKVPLNPEAAVEAARQLADQFDPQYGGFGYNPANPRRPKFPQPVDLLFLLKANRVGAKTPPATDLLAMVEKTLDQMARGGIRDHLGGGYHRYATDRFWRVPHFEKMLYDNAQLASVHLEAFEITHDPRWRDEAIATFAWIERKMTAPEGGFFSALDAETHAEEGAYYVWTRAEATSLLGEGPAAERFAAVYGLAGEPNFEGARYVLHEPLTRAEQARALKTTPETLESQLGPLRSRLLNARDKRPTPLCDDKVLTGWNGLMIAAYADGYRVLKVDRYRQAAEKAANFLLDKLRLPDGRLLRTYRQGQAKLAAYLEDYAFLAHGLLRLHAATGDRRWLQDARTLVDRMIADFEDRAEGGFFFTAEGHETLLARAKDPFDNALPSGNSMAILDLMALYAATGETSYRDHAGKALDAFSASLTQTPAAMPMIVVGLGQYLDSRPDTRAVNRLNHGVRDMMPVPTVTATARLAPGAPTAPAAGSEFDAVIRLQIETGWHIYANPTGLSDMKPTSLDLDPRSPRLARMVSVSYPRGDSKVLGSIGTEKVMLYEGTVELQARFQLAEDSKPGPGTIVLRLSYQACNDRLCQAPARLEIPLTVTAGK